MTFTDDLRAAISDIIRVRDAERRDEASTEDLLDAISELDRLTFTNSMQVIDVDDLVAGMDDAAYVLDQKGEHDAMREVLHGDTMQGLLGWIEPTDMTDIRYILRGLDYDSATPWFKTQPAYHFCLPGYHVAKIQDSLTALATIGFDVKTASTDGVPGNFDVTITQPVEKADAA